MKTLHVYQDNGHAWCKVKRSECIDLKILGDISKYSYQRKDHVYLEEDSDLRIYVDALKERDIEHKFTVHNSENSKIRGYSHFFLSFSEAQLFENFNQLKMIVRRLEEGREINRSDYTLIEISLRTLIK